MQDLAEPSLGDRMPNDLTGDFDVLLEVGDATLNRLVAAMHQNGFSNPDAPSLPHTAYFRLGDANSIAGEHGSVAAQIGCPRIELIDGATDRLWLTMGFRARYRADPGSPPLGDVIHGTIRAMYRIAPIGDDCPGWSGIAGDYLWLRVVRSSVEFDGAVYRTGELPFADALLDEVLVKSQIKRHLAALLATTFEARPHAIGPLFRRLLTRSGPTGSAVIIPVGPDGSAPTAGNINSVTRVGLQGSDCGVIVGSDYITRLVQEQVNGFIGFQRNIFHTVDAGVGGGLSLTYHFRVDSITTEWLGGTTAFVPAGIVKITVHCHGWASRLYRSGVFNVGDVNLDDLTMRAAVEQFLTIRFDPSSQRLVVAVLGDPNLKFIGPVASMVADAARGMIVDKAKVELAGRVSQAQADLDALSLEKHRGALEQQLRTIDPAAGAAFDTAGYDAAGIIIGGTIRMGHRYPARPEFVKADDHFDAIASWIPGGRVDRYEWSWHWFTSPIEKAPTPAGSRSDPDSFYLDRPMRPRSKFGPTIGADDPLPGLDGFGEVCLSIVGVYTDAVTGDLVPVRSAPRCVKFGYQFRMPVEMNGPYLRVCDPLREIGVLRCTATEDDQTSNTLVVYLGREWDQRLGEQLEAGLRQCARTNAGLVVVMLFEDGVLSRLADSEEAAQLRRLSDESAAPMLIAEDAYASWSRWLALADDDPPNWRLVRPDGLITWRGHGVIAGQELAAVLDERLVFSGPAITAGHADAAARVGSFLPIEIGGFDCPPIPLVRPGTLGSRVLFADSGSASQAAVGTLRRSEADDGQPPCVAVIVTNTAPDAVEAFAAQHQVSAEFFADPEGALTRRVGLTFTPSMVTLDAQGRVVEVQPL